MCGRDPRPHIEALDLDMRAGLHTGEIDLLDDDVSVIAVNIAQRVASIAGRGEVLGSATESGNEVAWWRPKCWRTAELAERIAERGAIANGCSL
jgi:class 3 adenylate cyclase